MDEEEQEENPYSPECCTRLTVTTRVETNRKTNAYVHVYVCVWGGGEGGGG
jgi:hypothetical protein